MSIQDKRRRPGGYKGDKPHLARVKDPASGKQPGKSFRTKAEAERWEREQKARIDDAPT